MLNAIILAPEIMESPMALPKPVTLKNAIKLKKVLSNHTINIMVSM